MHQCHFCSTENTMSPSFDKQWVEAYLRAALEVDGQKMPERIVAAREAVTGRLKDLEGNTDHHAERHEMQSALAALTSLEDETRIWPTAAIAHSMATLLPKLRSKTAAGGRCKDLLRKET
jgi:phage I-like protein